MRRVSISLSLVVAITAALCFAPRAGALVSPTAEEQILQASDAAIADNFASGIAISGDTAIMGAAGDDNSGGLDAGSAYAFTRSGGVWTEQQRFQASDALPSDNFGISVAVSGETAIVGAQSDDNSGGSNAGSAYVFTRSGGIWTEQQRLQASDAAMSDSFGISVAISGETAIVGAFGDNNTGGTDAGSAYVFTRSGSVWTEQQRLEASDAAVSDRFGGAVRIDGETAIVGAHLDDNAGGADAGSVYVFTRSGVTWSEQDRLEASDAAASDAFGVSVAFAGDTVIVGANGDDNSGGSNAGSAYAFTRVGGVWTEQLPKLQAPDAAVNDFFGSSVAIGEDMVVVGATGDNNSGGSDAGSAYVFTRSGGVWNPLTRLQASDAAALDQFGDDVAISGDTLVVAASFADPGFAYVFTPSAFSVNDVTVVEPDAGTTQASFTVTRTNGDTGASVEVHTSAGSASTDDFEPLATTLRFAPGELTKTVNIDVVGDTAEESAETFFLVLSNAEGAVIRDGSGRATISNDDASFAVNDMSITEGNSGTKRLSFRVSLSRPVVQATSVKVRTTNGSARAPSDYTTVPLTTLNFAAGQTSKVVNVTIKGERLREANETFNVLLSSATGGVTIRDARGIGTIRNDDR